MASITVREAIRDAIKEEMLRDEKIFILGEEVAEYQGAYKVTQGLLQQFGSKRVIDSPISEHGFTGLGIGAAFAGLRPIIEYMTFNFAMQAMDQIVNSAAKTHYMSGGQLHCPIVFRGPNGAAAQVAAQHSQCYAAWYSNIPGLKVVAPYFAGDYRGLLKASIRDNNPVIFLENEVVYGFTHEITEEELDENYIVAIGKANVLQNGEDVTICAFSICVKYALEAAEILKSQHNITAEIIDLRTIKPLDFETIKTSLQKTNKLITVEEGFPISGIGAEISAKIMEEAFDYLDAPVQRIAAKDVPLPYAKNLEKLALPNTQEIVEKAVNLCKFKI